MACSGRVRAYVESDSVLNMFSVLSRSGSSGGQIAVTCGRRLDECTAVATSDLTRNYPARRCLTASSAPGTLGSCAQACSRTASWCCKVLTF